MLYWISGDFLIVCVLIEVLCNGKQVMVFVEFKVCFDEVNNIQWVCQFEDVGVYVVYGFIGYKMYCKCSLVVCCEGCGLWCYVYFGMGNYNLWIVKFYIDLSYFMLWEEFMEDVVNFFNLLMGFSCLLDFQYLLVVLFNFYCWMQEFIQSEVDSVVVGCFVCIMVKMNLLVDKIIIDNFYVVLQVGVKIDFIVCGVCCFVLGVKGFSENICV